LQILETWDGEQMVVAVGRSAGTGKRPEESKPVVNDVEGFRFVSEMMLSVRSGLVFFFFGSIGVGLVGLVGSGIIYIGSQRIAKGGKMTMLKTGGGYRKATAILSCCLGGAGAMRGGLGAGRHLVTTVHV